MLKGYNKKYVYKACKVWAYLERLTLVEVWERFLTQPRFRKYLFFYYELERADVELVYGGQ